MSVNQWFDFRPAFATGTLGPPRSLRVGWNLKVRIATTMHSFEDSIQPVERFIDEWGDRIAVLGGVDVHLLSVGSESAIRSRVREILEYAAPRGGYACGSGNRIPNYISPENYLAMIETVAKFNGLRCRR